MVKNCTNIQDVSDITAHVYVCGYSPEGESILFFLYDEKQKYVLYSILIDSYFFYTNRLFKIFDKYDIENQKLDMIVWTHPHQDHSRGFESIIDKYCNKKTIYHIPSDMLRYKIDGEELCKDAKKSYEKIKSLKNGAVFPTKNVVGKSTEIINCEYEDKNKRNFSFSVKILTPHSNFLFNELEEKSSVNGNAFSISLLIKVGQMNFLFGGDTENDAWKCVPKDDLKYIDFVKIPHHGSDSASNIIQHVTNRKTKALGACTSYVKGKKHLPQSNILNQYGSICDSIYLTRGNNKKKYGLVEYVFKISEMSVYEPNLFGDAVKF